MSDEKARNVISVSFGDDGAEAYRALSQLKAADANGSVRVHGAVVIERQPDGRIKIADGVENQLGAGSTGSLIGLLIGIIGGPFGILIGWGAGALIGGVVDASRGAKTSAAIGAFARAVTPGQNALIADVTELDESVVDQLAGSDGTVVRRTAHEVLDEAAAAAEAAKEAQQAADRKLHEEHRAERREDIDERWQRVKEKLDL